MGETESLSKKLPKNRRKMVKRKRDLEACAETPLFLTPDEYTLDTINPTVMTGECDSRGRKNGRGVTVKCSSCCMFLWVVLLILTGFLIGHHFFRSGSIVNHVSSPEGENQAAEMIMRSQDVQKIAEVEIEIAEIKDESDGRLGKAIEKATNTIGETAGGIVQNLKKIFGFD